MPPRTKREAALACVELFGQLAALFVERRKQLAEQAGLTVQQWQVLEVVQEEHFMPSLFAAERDSSPAAVSKILRQLSDKGLLDAELSRVDGRQRNYRVTATGKACLDGLRAERETAIERVWLKFSDADLEQFQGIGQELARRLSEVALDETKESKE